ncbi:hypothetical protein C8R30_1288 [Nitrosomonas nitrosa]|uniref:hypothetical protein n=1 Tax=Nitrosomonas nitrosa TaxID=52442 RepID=UPI000D301F01|nr:hypothetical protein [Nitrosomonas nitrosa]PTQ91788.1 hypothetical protein C8R30_1288 [Nitrosomonas nitrosa]
MKKSDLSIAVIGLFSLLLLSGCYKDGDGKLELKEPKKELSEMPERKNWLQMDVSDPDKFKKQMDGAE